MTNLVQIDGNSLQYSDVLALAQGCKKAVFPDTAREKVELARETVLGIIERGETDHGLVMGQSVTGAVIELQIKHNKPIGLGIIGPGAEPEHVGPRLEPHARAAVGAVAAMAE